MGRSNIAVPSIYKEVHDSGDNGRLKLGPVKTRNKSSRPTFDQRFSPASPENVSNIDEFEPYEPDERNLMYAFKEPTLPDASLIGGRLLIAAWEEGLGTIHILRKHLYSTKLVFFVKTREFIFQHYILTKISCCMAQNWFFSSKQENFLLNITF